MSLDLADNIRGVTDEDQNRIIEQLKNNGLTYDQFQENYDLSRYQVKKAVELLKDQDLNVVKKQETYTDPKKYLIEQETPAHGETNDVTRTRDTSESKRVITRDSNEYLAELEKTVKQAKKELGPLNPDLEEPVNQGNQTLVMHRGDDHFGAQVEDETGEILFDSDTAEERVRNYFTEAIKTANQKNTQFDSATLLLGGDIVTNEAIYQGQAYDIDATIDEQINRATAVYIEQIKRLSEKFPMVKIVCQHGNHGEFQGKQQSKGANADDIIYNHLEMMAKRENMENVRFVMSERANYTNFTIRNHNAHLRHGHNVKTHVGTSSPQRDWRGYLHNHDFDIAYRGHYHNHRVENVMGVPIIMAPSIMPPGSHEEELAVFGEPMSYIHGASDETPFAWVEYITYKNQQ